MYIKIHNVKYNNWMVLVILNWKRGRKKLIDLFIYNKLWTSSRKELNKKKLCINFTRLLFVKVQKHSVNYELWTYSLYITSLCVWCFTQIRITCLGLNWLLKASFFKMFTIHRFFFLVWNISFLLFNMRNKKI